LVPAKLTYEARTVMMSWTIAKPSESRDKVWKAWLNTDYGRPSGATLWKI
jgi:hypothetical protein